MIQNLAPGARERHRHRDGYAALVLSGHYDEVGDTGRWAVEAGDIVYHRPYEAHANLIPTSCTVLNIPIPAFVRLPAVFRAASPDELIKVANLEWPIIANALRPKENLQARIAHWCDQLAKDLRAGPIQLREWAAANGIRTETLSRRFKQIYGVSPARYRLEAQTRMALDLITYHSESLAEIALKAGFSDQAHMTRAVKSLTGVSPAAWRKVNSIQETTMEAV